MWCPDAGGRVLWGEGMQAFEFVSARLGCPLFLRLIVDGMGRRLWCPHSPEARTRPGLGPALPPRGVSSVSRKALRSLRCSFPM